MTIHRIVKNFHPSLIKFKLLNFVINAISWCKECFAYLLHLFHVMNDKYGCRN